VFFLNNRQSMKRSKYEMSVQVVIFYFHFISE
jgi:hypothetical protein